MITSISGPILLTGVNGQVGSDLLPLLQTLGPVVAPTRADLDLTDTTAVRELVRHLHPRWIVNAAAYTAVDKAEIDSATAFAVNGDAPRALGEEAARLGTPVLHFSTDYVFSGEGSRPWREDDPTGPLNVYGASKLAGEQALAGSHAPYLVFRTSWVYGTRGKNFFRTMLQLAREREDLKIVDDQYGAPTWSRNLALLIAHLIAGFEQQTTQSGRTLAEAVNPVSGIYHACDAGVTTWFGFATELVRLAKLDQPRQRFASITPIPTHEYPTPAKRPASSRLDCGKLSRVFAYSMPRWQDATASVSALLASELS
ncbi:MAG: dTDP-4-dehydrorhamnose reductase [Janthinobacterium lividum]